MHISGKQQAVTYPAIIPPGTGRKAGIHFIQRISYQAFCRQTHYFSFSAAITAVLNCQYA